MKRVSIFNRVHNPRRDANLFLLFFFGTPIVALAVGACWPGEFNPVVFIGVVVFFAAHGVMGLLFGMARLHSGDEEQQPRSGGRKSLIIAIVVVGLFSLFELFLPATRFSRSDSQAARSPSCQNNLKQWGLVHKMHAIESEVSEFPPLSPNPGQLTPAFGVVYPTLLTDLDILQCPRKYQPSLRIPYDAEFFGTAADQSYLYLGYLIDGPKTLRAFRNAYEKVVAAGGDFESDLVVPEGHGTWAGNRIFRLSEDVKVFRHNADFDASSSAEIAQIQSSIPIMIERLTYHHRARWGSTILFMDGHVEFRRFPGEWPMTEEAMDLLHEIDAMGPYIPEGAVDTHRGRIEMAWPWVTIALGIVLFILVRFIRCPAITVPLVYGLFAIAVYTLVLLESPSHMTLPIATPGGDVRDYSVKLLRPT